MSAEEESHPSEPKNMEGGNIKDGNLWVNLIESMNYN